MFEEKLKELIRPIVTAGLQDAKKVDAMSNRAAAVRIRKLLNQLRIQAQEIRKDLLKATKKEEV